MPPAAAVVGAFKNVGRHYDKTIQPRLRRVEMHPYSRYAGLPPEGEVLATLCLEMLMRTKAERRANLPLRGRCRRQKGCISIGRSPVMKVFVTKVSAAAAGGTI